MKPFYKSKRLAYILVFISIAICQINTLHAQSKPLPYKTGWDNATEKSGWTFHQLKSTTYGSWDYGGTGAPSPPYFIDHDYPVGNSNADTVDDWIVSPPLNISGKSQISLKANVYTIGQTQPFDTFSIMYSKTSPDPKTGTFKKIVDLAFWGSNQFSLWHDTSGIAVNDSGPSVYIAFRYRETLNWFTVHFDDFEIKAVHNSGIDDENQGISHEATLFPNPAHSFFTLTLPNAMLNKNLNIIIYDMTGRQVLSKENNGAQKVQFDTNGFSNGIYQYRVIGDANMVLSGKFIVN